MDNPDTLLNRRVIQRQAYGARRTAFSPAKYLPAAGLFSTKDNECGLFI
ncbi:hypothetical protein [Raoultella sp. T31]